MYFKYTVGWSYYYFVIIQFIDLLTKTLSLEKLYTVTQIIKDGHNIFTDWNILELKVCSKDASRCCT